MTTSKGASNYNKLNWEQSDFPIVCESCFGDNAFMRMTKERYGKECGVCTRPFTVFRWQNGSEGRFLETEICQVCTRTKNVCQSCILDLDWALPVAVRDKYLPGSSRLPEAPVNLEYGQQILEREIGLSGDPASPHSDYSAPGKAARNSIRLLSRLAKTEPYSRHAPRLCTFYLRGECRRGDTCPFRHAVPSDPLDPVNEQHIRERYYGLDDCVADRIIERYEAARAAMLAPPEDRSITTLEISGLSGTDAEVISVLYRFGEIRSVHRLFHSNSSEADEHGGGDYRLAVRFAARDSAERAVQTINEWQELGHGMSARWALSNHAPLQSPQAPPVARPVSVASGGTKRWLPPLPLDTRAAPSTAPPSAPSASTAVGAGGQLYDSQRPDRIGNKIHPA